jgi:hypothetical protein
MGMINQAHIELIIITGGGVLRDKEGRRRRRNAHSWPGFPDRRFSYKVSNTAKSFNAVPNLVHPCLDIDGFGSCNCYYFLFD